MIRLWIAALILLSLSPAAMAQTGGQFCVRAFEDRNSNGIRDTGEPLLNSGVSADLLNAEQIVIASALLSDSPTAVQGIICFQMLAEGQYSLVVTAAEFTPTTPNTLTASISDGTLPTVMEFGARRLDMAPAAAEPAASPLSDRDMLARMVLSGLGALVAMAGMVVLGVLIYLVIMRPRPAYAPAYPEAVREAAPTPTPGSIPPVVASDDSLADTDEIQTL